MIFFLERVSLISNQIAHFLHETEIPEEKEAEAAAG